MEAISGNLCRCGCYNEIVEAIEAVADGRRKEVKTMTDYVGKPVPRYDGIGHVTARTTYVDDIQKPGMLYIKVLTSPVHKGIIRRLDLSAAEKMPGVAGVITAKDVPGTECLRPDPRSARFHSGEHPLQGRTNRRRGGGG